MANCAVSRERTCAGSGHRTLSRARCSYSQKPPPPTTSNVSSQKELDLVGLDDALNRLAAMDERQSRIVELRFFAGLSVEETAEVMGISTPTVKREWSSARAWLYREIQGKTSRDS